MHPDWLPVPPPARARMPRATFSKIATSSGITVPAAGPAVVAAPTATQAPMPDPFAVVSRPNAWQLFASTLAPFPIAVAFRKAAEAPAPKRSELTPASGHEIVAPENRAASPVPADAPE